jgi:hypothetical protein
MAARIPFSQRGHRMLSWNGWKGTRLEWEVLIISLFFVGALIAMATHPVPPCPEYQCGAIELK